MCCSYIDLFALYVLKKLKCFKTLKTEPHQNFFMLKET